MSSSWISMPVENAKEVIQRYVNRNVATLTAYANKTVRYESDCEIYLDKSDITNLVHNAQRIYIGYFYFPTDFIDAENSMQLRVDDGTSNLIVFNNASNNVSQSFSPIIFNKIHQGPIKDCVFIGYKFIID